MWPETKPDIESLPQEAKVMIAAIITEYKRQEQENAKLKRLLAEACEAMRTIELSDTAYNMLEDHCSEELKQWFEEHKKQEESK